MKNRMTKEWNRQLQWAIGMLLATATGWALLCGDRIAQNGLFYICFSFLTLFVSILTIWIVALLGLCKFPGPEGSSHLYHSTPHWGAIKQSSCLFPTADGQVYFTDKPRKLGQRSCNGTDTMLVFKEARAKCVARPARFHPCEYQRFKQGRGEWLAPPFLRVVIEEFVEDDSGRQVTVESYRLEELGGTSCKLLRTRRAAAALFLSPLFISGLLAASITEASLRKVPPWHLVGFWIVISLVAGLAIFYKLQGMLNSFIFRNK